jgi:DNA-directed RNA polymerase specialized sigma24 family protein
MIVELRVYQELSFRDIAQALDTTANAAKVGFHHAIKNLRRLLVPVEADRPPQND